MSVLGRIVRRLLVRAIRFNLRRRRTMFIGAVTLSGIIVAGAFNFAPLRGLDLPGFIGQSRPRPDGEPAATAMYFKGQEVYDAKLVWDSYSERALREAQRRGLTVDDTQRQLDRAKEFGTRIQQTDYIGGYPISNGSMHFYVVFRSDPNRREAVPVPYVFTLDAGGKIDYIE